MGVDEQIDTLRPPMPLQRLAVQRQVHDHSGAAGCFDVTPTGEHVSVWEERIGPELVAVAAAADRLIGVIDERHGQIIDMTSFRAPELDALRNAAQGVGLECFAERMKLAIGLANFANPQASYDALRATRASFDRLASRLEERDWTTFDVQINHDIFGVLDDIVGILGDFCGNLGGAVDDTGVDMPTCGPSGDVLGLAAQLMSAANTIAEVRDQFRIYHLEIETGLSRVRDRTDAEGEVR